MDYTGERMVLDIYLTCHYCGNKYYDAIIDCSICPKKICFYNCKSKIYLLNNKIFCNDCYTIKLK